MSNKTKMLVVDKGELKRLMSEKKGFAARNEKKIECRFAKYPFGYVDCLRSLHISSR